MLYWAVQLFPYSHPSPVTGMKLVMTEDMNYRNTSIVGLAAALGMGVSQASASFPHSLMGNDYFLKIPVVIATLVASLNVTLPRDKKLVHE